MKEVTDTKRRSFSRRTFVTLVAMLLLVALPLGAEDVPDPEREGLSAGERLEQLLERIKYEQARLKTMEAGFTQRKESAFLLEPEESKGQFWYRSPDSVRWDFSAPNDTVVLVRAEEMLTWFKDLGSAERVHVGKQADRVMEYLSAGNSLETLERYFEVRTTFPKDPEAPFKLNLKPKFKRVEKRVKSMAIHLHRTGYYPVYLKYEDPDGSLTEFVFSDVEINQEIADQTFVVELPEDVEVKEVELGKKGKKAKKSR